MWSLKRMSLIVLVVLIGLAVPLVTALIYNQGFATDLSSVSFHYTFENGKEGWEGGFADYPVENADPAIYEMVFERKKLPAELKTAPNDKALFIQGHNRSDDLFMFVKRKLDATDGIEPNTTYTLEYEVNMATNVAAGLIGIGGAPGESVYVKAGATAVEPQPVRKDGWYRMNIDKGNQSSSGNDAAVIGNIAKTKSGGDAYEIKTLTNTDQPLQVTSDKNGELWLIVGTDSGFEGLTQLYYSSINVELAKK